MKRPLVPVAISYAAGLVLAENLCPPVSWLFLGGFGLLAACALLVRRTPIEGPLSLDRQGLLPLTVVLIAGWINMAWRTDLQSPFDLRQIFSPEPQTVTLRGRLTWTPEHRIRTYGNRDTTRTLAWLDTEAAIRHGHEWQPARGQVLVITPGALQETLDKGARVEITGVLAEPPGSEAEGLFNYREYLARQSIHFQLRASGTNDWTILEAGSPSCSKRFVTWATATLTRGVPEGDKPLLLLLSMSLGARSRLEHEHYEPFIRTGTMHIFAVSGLHVALISGLILAVLRFVRVPRSLCGLIALPLIWFYTAATGWQPSAIRAAIMTSVLICGWALARPTDLINSLCAAALLILVWDPQQLFGASFQLSFFVVLSIALLLPRIEYARDRWLGYDPLLPADLVPAWRRWLNRPARYITSAFGISLAAWLGALPLTIYYFHLFNPITLLANVVIVPLSSFALACNMGSIVFGNWLAPVTELLNKAALASMSLTVGLCDALSELSWGVVNVRSLYVPEVLAYYGLLLGVFSGWLLRKPRFLWALGAVLAVCFGWLIALHYISPKSEITVLPVDGGLAIHSTTDGREILIDCGKTNAVERLVAPFLRARGINSIDGLVLTHGDVNHVGGAEFIAELFRIGHVHASDLNFRSAVYKGCVKHFNATGQLLRVGLGGEAGGWHVLHPMPGEKASRADEGVLVLASRIGGTRVLLISDLDRAGQELLINRGVDVRADIVITGLPDSGEPLCDPLLERIKPQVIIIGDSERPSYDRVKPKVASRLRSKGVRVICTSIVGVTRIEFRENGEYAIKSQAD